MKRSLRYNSIFTFSVIFISLILVNIISGQFFFRLDLTEEKRYSLAESTKTLLSDLENVVYIEIFLEGEMPADFQRLQQSIKEILDEFKVYAGYNLQYEFRNPSPPEADNKSRQEIFKQIYDRGINPTTLYVNQGDERSEKIIFPGAIVNYLNMEMPVNFLKYNYNAGTRAQLNQSIEGLEYELISTIKKLSKPKKKKIAFLQGHGELDPIEAEDILRSLSEYYDVRRVRLQSATNGDFEGTENLDAYDAIIMASPDSAFNEVDKFKIDQYLVKGGNALFFIDAMKASIDSIGNSGSVAISNDLKLDDIFFKMGLRLNPDLIQDQLCAFIPLIVGYVGDRPQYQMMKWWYYPILNNFAKHPISRNMNGVYSKFISSIDTVKSPGIKKTPLVFTSPETRVLSSPVRLDFNDVRVPPNPQLFNKGKLAVAYLLEGKYRSNFEGRVTQKTAEKFNYKTIDKASKIIVFSDADIIENDINSKSNTAYPLGYDKFTKNTFANKDLILNCIDYMLDDSGIIEARNKQVVSRPLNINYLPFQSFFIGFSYIEWPTNNLFVPGFNNARVVKHIIYTIQYQVF
ncbi:MAG: gliding motility-associated ABC transporter substrate-binding protein GldG, partial [Cytophagales bacterium]